LQNTEVDDRKEKMNTFNITLHNDDEKWMPTKAHESDAGFDLRARAYSHPHKLDKESKFPVQLDPGSRLLIKTGVTIELKEGWEAQVRPRSGMALKTGITITNSPGTIDAQFRGEIGIILQNVSQGNSLTIKEGDKIAQMVIKEVPNVTLNVVDSLDETERGSGGFGSSGK